MLSIYVKNIYPQLHFQFEQLLDASYNVWHRLNDEEKISLATFLEEISRDVRKLNFYAEYNYRPKYSYLLCRVLYLFA
jgi:hypothetical protein